MHRPELDGTEQKDVEYAGNYSIVQAWARLTPTLTHVVTYELVTSGAEDDAMSFAEDALNINNMNMNPGRKQRKLRDTIIPLNNPDLAPSDEDTRGQIQWMSFSDDHIDPKLRGQPKGVRAVLQERKSVWHKFTAICKERGTKVVGKCASCTKSQTRKDAERRVALAKAMWQDDLVSVEDTKLIESETLSRADDQWCCMHHVLLLQEDFRTEKPLVQSIIETARHVCLFLPRFHCELNPIEMLWGFTKYRAWKSSHVHNTLILSESRICRISQLI